MSDSKQTGRGTTAKVLMPVIATVASGLASYLAKKAPQYLEQKVKPKIQEAKESAGGVVQNGSGEARSNDELEQRRRERAEHRAARQKAS